MVRFMVRFVCSMSTLGVDEWFIDIMELNENALAFDLNELRSVKKMTL